MRDPDRLLIITPTRNEAAHLEAVVRSVGRQSRRPDLWLVVDDGSSDGTPELLGRLAEELSFMHVLATPPGHTVDRGDRHAAAAAPRAFNWALATVRWREFTHIGKLDGDIELPEDYFERLLHEFGRRPSLGIGGGTVVERVGGGAWQTMPVARHHVRGALKLYRRECLEAIGGMQERLGWDGIDGTYARMRGYETRSFEDLLVRHHRALGTADGALRGRIRRGEVNYVLGFGLAWSALKALQLAAGQAGPGAGGAFLYGYVAAAMRATPRVGDEDYRRFMRREQRLRMRHALTRPAMRGS